MSSFVNTFDPNTPTGTDSANTLDTVIQTHKKGEDERYGLEHVELSDAQVTKEHASAAGRHIPGLVGVLASDTTSALNTLAATKSGAGVGAIAYDTTLKKLVRWNGSAWATILTPGSSVNLTPTVDNFTLAGSVTSETSIASGQATSSMIDLRGWVAYVSGSASSSTAALFRFYIGVASANTQVGAAVLSFLASSNLPEAKQVSLLVPYNYFWKVTFVGGGAGTWGIRLFTYTSVA